MFYSRCPLSFYYVSYVSVKIQALFHALLICTVVCYQYSDSLSVIDSLSEWIVYNMAIKCAHASHL